MTSIGNMKAKMWDTSTLHSYKYLKNSVLNVTVTAITIKAVFLLT